MRASPAILLAILCLQPSRAETPQQISRRGVELFQLGNYQQAEQAYRDAITKYKQAATFDVNGYAATLNNLAITLQVDGRLSEARQLLREVVSLDSQIHGEDSIITHALSNLALLHQTDGEHAKAIAVLHRVLDRSGANAQTRAGALHNLGSMYFDLGRNKKAREFFEASLEISNQPGIVGDTPATISFLARIAFREGDLPRAYLNADRALTLRRQTLGQNHPLVALSLDDLAEMYREAKRYEEAARTFEEALQVLQASVGTDHHYAAPVLFHYGEARRLQGRNQEALRLYEHAADILRRTYGPDHLRLAVVYRSAALSAAKLKRKAESKQYTSRADSIERDRIPFGRYTIDASSFNSRK